jgi:hypothetical protein
MRAGQCKDLPMRFALSKAGRAKAHRAGAATKDNGAPGKPGTP